MSAARPPEGAHAPGQGVREAHAVASLGGSPRLAARPPEGAHAPGQGVREAHAVASLGENK